MKSFLIPSLFLLMLPFASMGQSKSNEKSNTFTTGSGETVTINTNATVTQESNGTYDVNVNRSINAFGTTSAAGDINTTLVANPDSFSATANTTYVGSQGADGTITSTVQPGVITTTVNGSEFSGSAIRQQGMVSKAYNTPQGSVLVQKGEGQITISAPSSQLYVQTSDGSATINVDSCESGVCLYASSTKSVDNGVVTTTYSGSNGGSATMTYSGTNNGSGGDSTRTITTSSGETVTINSSAAGDDINKSIIASGTTSGALNVNTTLDNGTATTTYISSSGVDKTVTRGSTTNTGTSTSTSTAPSTSPSK